MDQRVRGGNSPVLRNPNVPDSVSGEDAGNLRNGFVVVVPPVTGHHDSGGEQYARNRRRQLRARHGRVRRDGWRAVARRNGPRESPGAPRRDSRLQHLPAVGVHGLNKYKYKYEYKYECKYKIEI